MAAQKLTEAQFVSEFQRIGSVDAMAREHGIDRRNIQRRRASLMEQGHNLASRPADGVDSRVPIDYRDTGWTFPREKQIEIDTGAIVISSDHHYWPGEPTVAHKALLAVIRKVKPRVKIVNGDVFDGVSVCRHPPFGWSDRPSVMDELSACQERLGEIEQALPRGCERLWNIGNHDQRFERTLAMQASEFKGLAGFRLEDHFHGWDMQWSTLINPNAAAPVMVKHRFAGGIHAGYNNAVKSGLTIVTGHTHLLEAKAIGNYRGRFWGVQTGTLADTDGPQFEYMENAPTHACSGFAVLTFRDGKLLPPELCEVHDGVAFFRGEVVA